MLGSMPGDAAITDFGVAFRFTGDVDTDSALVSGLVDGFASLPRSGASEGEPHWLVGGLNFRMRNRSRPTTSPWSST